MSIDMLSDVVFRSTPFKGLPDLGSHFRSQLLDVALLQGSDTSAKDDALTLMYFSPDAGSVLGMVDGTRGTRYADPRISSFIWKNSQDFKNDMLRMYSLIINDKPRQVMRRLKKYSIYERNIGANPYLKEDFLDRLLSSGDCSVLHNSNYSLKWCLDDDNKLRLVDSNGNKFNENPISVIDILASPCIDMNIIKASLKTSTSYMDAILSNKYISTPMFLEAISLYFEESGAECMDVPKRFNMAYKHVKGTPIEAPFLGSLAASDPEFVKKFLIETKRSILQRINVPGFEDAHLLSSQFIDPMFEGALSVESGLLKEKIDDFLRSEEFQHGF